MHLSRLLGVLLGAISLLATACQPASSPPPGAQWRGEEAIDLVWPQPPRPPRIRFLMAVSRPQDVGIRPSFWERVGRLIGGESERSFIRPTGVAATDAALYVADPGAQALWILDAAAGKVRIIRDADAQPLVSPVGVTIGAGDRVYVADSYLAAVFVYSGTGRFDATIASPDFRSPAGVAYDADRDRLYVADSAAHAIWIRDGNGNPKGRIGQRGTGGGEFNFPSHVAVDRAGMLYVTDALNFRVQLFTPDGSFAAQFGRHGDSSGEFAMPKGVAVDSEGHIYVAEALFDAVQIFDRDGKYLLTFGERGLQPGQFWLPGGLSIDRRDRIYVADAYNRRLQVFQYLGGGVDE